MAQALLAGARAAPPGCQAQFDANGSDPDKGTGIWAGAF